MPRLSRGGELFAVLRSRGADLIGRVFLRGLGLALLGGAAQEFFDLVGRHRFIRRTRPRRIGVGWRVHHAAALIALPGALTLTQDIID